MRTGSRTRSSIELIGSLGALDVIEGNLKRLVVVGWLVVPVIVAAAMLAGAAGRLRLSAVLVTPVGPVVIAIIAIVLIAAGNVLAWGAYVTLLFGLFATGSAIMVIMRLADPDLRGR